MTADQPDILALLVHVAETLLEVTERMNDEVAELRELKDAFKTLYIEHAIHLELQSYEEREKRKKEFQGKRGSGGFDIAERGGKVIAR